MPEVIGYRSAEDEANGIARALRERARAGGVLVVPGGPRADQRADGAHRVGAPAGPHPLPGPRVAAGFIDEPEVRELLSGLERLREPLATTLPDLESGLARRQAELGMPVHAVGPDGSGSRRGDMPASPVEPDPDSAVARRLAAHEQ